MAISHQEGSESQTNRHAQLRSAIDVEDLASLDTLIQGDRSLLQSVIDDSLDHPLTYAAWRGKVAAVEYLLEVGANVHESDDAALFRACLFERNIPVMELLVRHGADVNAVRENYGPIAIGTCEYLRPRTLEWFLRNGLQTDQAILCLLARAVIGTFFRNPPGKHECLEILRDAGAPVGDDPIMALHRGRIDVLGEHLRRDPGLIHRRFSETDLDGSLPGLRSSTCCTLTPIAGTTLLHLAMEYDEYEAAEWLLNEGADIDALATVGVDGCGGHSPLFHAVLSPCSRDTAAPTRFLLDFGADPTIRASVRHPVRGWAGLAGRVLTNVSPLEYALAFESAPGWINRCSINVLQSQRMPL